MVKKIISNILNKTLGGERTDGQKDIAELSKKIAKGAEEDSEALFGGFEHLTYCEIDGIRKSAEAVFTYRDDKNLQNAARNLSYNELSNEIKSNIDSAARNLCQANTNHQNWKGNDIDSLRDELDKAILVALGCKEADKGLILKDIKRDPNKNSVTKAFIEIFKEAIKPYPKSLVTLKENHPFAGKKTPDDMSAQMKFRSEVLDAQSQKPNPTNKAKSGTILTKEEMDKLYERDDNEPYWNR